MSLATHDHPPAAGWCTTLGSPRGRRLSGRIRRHVGRILLAVGLAAGALAVSAAPAHASSPRCTSDYWSYRYDSNGDAALADAYSPWVKPTQPFHYWLYIPVATSSSVTWRCWLGTGHTGTAVKALQTSLNRCYGTPSVNHIGGHSLGFNLVVDGVYGSRTASAVLAVQRYLHLDRDGTYGPQTAGAMRFFGETGNDSGVAVTFCHTMAA